MAKILVVDDSKVMRITIKGALAKLGHELYEANDGDIALDLCKSHDFDLILTDVNMPNMSGTALLIRLRRLPNYLNTPIIMITTEGEGFKKDNAKQSGASGWIKKPFNPTTLCDAVTGYLT